MRQAQIVAGARGRGWRGAERQRRRGNQPSKGAHCGMIVSTISRVKLRDASSRGYACSTRALASRVLSAALRPAYVHSPSRASSPFVQEGGPRLTQPSRVRKSGARCEIHFARIRAKMEGGAGSADCFPQLLELAGASGLEVSPDMFAVVVELLRNDVTPQGVVALLRAIKDAKLKKALA